MAVAVADVVVEPARDSSVSRLRRCRLGPALVVASLLASMIAGGCSLGAVATVPLTGPAPRSVAVWPGITTQYSDAAATLFAGLGPALRSRGYRTTSVAVARQLLRDAGSDAPTPSPVDLGSAGLTIGVDAVLVLEVHDFEATGDRAGRGLDAARWSLGWRLLSTRGHGVLWQHSHGGAWRRSSEQRFDSLERLDFDNTVIPVGRDPGWSFRDADELAANLHRLALMHLPVAPVTMESGR